MSCFVVNKRHIDYLASYFSLHQRDLYLYRNGSNWILTPREVGQILWNENRRSYEWLYNEVINWDVYNFAQYPNLARLSDHRQVIQACNCLNYQSCETEDWKNSDAYKILKALREHAIGHLLPESLLWEITE